MSQTDRQKWDARYLAGAYVARRHTSPLLERWLERLEFARLPRRAVDIACGAGRNSLYLARHGWHVDAIDISAIALQRLKADAITENLPIRCFERDLDELPEEPNSFQERPDARRDGLYAFKDRRYALAVMMRYADLPLVESLERTIFPGGCLIAEMHLQTSRAVAGPRTSRFRVAPEALRRAAALICSTTTKESSPILTIGPWHWRNW